jgi:membrane-bound ClpP family serine protease
MSVIALAVVIVLLIALLASVHVGPHAVMVTSSALTVALSGAIVLVGLGTLFVAEPLLALIILALALVGSAATLMWGYKSARSREVGTIKRDERLRDCPATAVTDLTPNGIVRVEGEQWTAESLDGPIRAGTAVLVSEVHGLRLTVIIDPLSSDRPQSVAHKTKES